MKKQGLFFVSKLDGNNIAGREIDEDGSEDYSKLYEADKIPTRSATK